jgi:RND superfamily putative drug exporter
LLVPAIMHLLGRANWWMPAWLGRALPELHVEGRPHEHLPARRQPEPVLVTSAAG